MFGRGYSNEPPRAGAAGEALTHTLSRAMTTRLPRTEGEGSVAIQVVRFADLIESRRDRVFLITERAR